ncbi:ASTRA-associated protein 1 [Hypsizygus marmoreus]|uniref:ASTRA-associated protein 1 n=1 Tax=Hypsizygus marmoreus TaxID=39966 RepID=A0A369JWG0_HYPMA|nr:ASTRA-associated protein 1 [Hypsizygus marmoreus]
MTAPPPPPSPTHILRTHTSPISALSFSPDNERLYSGDSAGHVVVTSTRSLRAITSWNAHTDSVLGVEEWGQRVITHARDNKLHVWTRVEELPPSARLGGSAAQADLPRPTLCYSMDVNALNYCRFSLLNLSRGNDAAALIALPNLVDSSVADVWSLPARERIHAAIGQAGRKSIFSSEPGERSQTGIIMSLHLFSVARSSSSSSQLDDELRLLCAYENGGVTLRRYVRTEKEKSVEGAGWDVVWDVKVHVDTIMAMRVSRKNDFALTVSADHIVGRYDLMETKEPIAHKTKHPGNAAIAIRDDGRVCAIAGWDGRVRLYSTRSLKPLGTLKYHKTGCQAVEFARSISTATEEIPGDDHHKEEGDEEEEDDDGSGAEMSLEEKADRARWLVAGGKDTRVSIWSLMSFEKS